MKNEPLLVVVNDDEYYVYGWEDVIGLAAGRAPFVSPAETFRAAFLADVSIAARIAVLNVLIEADHPLAVLIGCRLSLEAEMEHAPVGDRILYAAVLSRCLDVIKSKAGPA